MCSGEVCAFTQGNEARLVSEDVNAASKPLSMEGSEDEWEGKWREPGEAYDKNSEGANVDNSTGNSVLCFMIHTLILIVK